MITARGLTKRYGRTAAVRDLTFTVRPGMVTGFLGPNGAGKSTTMRMLIGLDRRLRDRDGWRAVGYTGIKLPLAIAEGYAATATVIGLADFVYPLVWLLFRNHSAGTKLGPLIAVAPIPDRHWAIDTLPGTLTASLAGVGCVVAGVWVARGSLPSTRG
jgi:energy-coupling factor transporter ATP-binding protein EcfA2